MSDHLFVDSCKINGKTNNTIYVPYGRSFSVIAINMCDTSTSFSLDYTWKIHSKERQNYILAYIPMITMTTGQECVNHSDIKACGNSSMSILIIKNATMAYNGTLCAVTECVTLANPRGENNVHTIKIIITGIWYNYRPFKLVCYV